MYVDNCAMQLVKTRSSLTSWLQRTCSRHLSDQASVLAGSLGMLASASLGGGLASTSRPTARPRISPAAAGQPHRDDSIGRHAAALLPNLADEADCIERAVTVVLEQGCRTADLMEEGKIQVGTAEMGDRIIGQIDPPETLK